MENLSQYALPLAGLVGFHVCFFRSFYLGNRFIHARGEPLEMEFPASRYLGQWLRRCGFWSFHVEDPGYFPCYEGLPILASFYPWHRFQAWWTACWPVDLAWILFGGGILGHFLLASMACYVFLLQTYPVVVAWFGAMTLTYLAYAIKQNCSIVYTVTWLPLLLLAASAQNGWLYGMSLSLALLAGYWPLTLPVCGWSICLWYWP